MKERCRVMIRTIFLTGMIVLGVCIPLIPSFAGEIKMYEMVSDPERPDSEYVGSSADFRNCDFLGVLRFVRLLFETEFQTEAAESLSQQLLSVSTKKFRIEISDCKFFRTEKHETRLESTREWANPADIQYEFLFARHPEIVFDVGNLDNEYRKMFLVVGTVKMREFWRGYGAFESLREELYKTLGPVTMRGTAYAYFRKLPDADIQARGQTFELVLEVEPRYINAEDLYARRQ